MCGATWAEAICMWLQCVDPRQRSNYQLRPHIGWLNNGFPIFYFAADWICFFFFRQPIGTFLSSICSPLDSCRFALLPKLRVPKRTPNHSMRNTAHWVRSPWKPLHRHQRRAFSECAFQAKQRNEFFKPRRSLAGRINYGHKLQVISIFIYTDRILNAVQGGKDRASVWFFPIKAVWCCCCHCCTLVGVIELLAQSLTMAFVGILMHSIQALHDQQILIIVQQFFVAFFCAAQSLTPNINVFRLAHSEKMSTTHNLSKTKKNPREKKWKEMSNQSND